MATMYIPSRTTNITRAELLEVFPDAEVSKNDGYQGLTIHTANSVCVHDEGDFAWVRIVDDRVTSIDLYGRNGTAPIEFLEESFPDTMFISEHDELYSYHDFPVDVETNQPVATADGGWELHECDGIVYLYNRTHNSYWSHIQAPVDNYNINEMSEETE